MRKKQLIRILLLEENPVEAEWYIQSLRSTQFALRSYLAKDTQSFEAFLNERTYDLILFISTAKTFEIENTVQLVHKAGQDAPLIAICDGKDRTALMEARNSAIQAGATEVIDNRNKIQLVHTVFRELNWLNDRRELKRNRFILHLKEEQCRQLSDISRQPIAHLHYGRLYYVNEEFTDRFGVADIQNPNDNEIYDFIADDDKEAFGEFLHSLDEHSFAPVAVEANFINTKGEAFTATAELSPVSYHHEDFVQLLLTDEKEDAIQETIIRGSGVTTENKQKSAPEKNSSHQISPAPRAEKPKPVSPKSMPPQPVTPVEPGSSINKEEKMAGNIEPVTGLYNSKYFYDALDQVIESSVKEHIKNTLLCIQHDNLGEVNSRFGVVKTKDILINTASLLSLSISPEDIAARLAEDIYGILLKNTDLNSATQIAEKIIAEQKRSAIKIEGKKVNAPLSVGVVPITDPETTRQELIANAFSACRTARKSSDKKIKTYSSESEDPTHLAGTLHLTREILEAINKNLFRLVYQPIASMKGQEGEYYEVLLRMEDSNGNKVPTDTLFIHASEHKLSTIIDEWVISTALVVLNIHLKQGRNLHFFINLSSESIMDKNILAVIGKYMKANEIAGDKLTFEISESTFTRQTSEVLDFIQGLKKLHCRIAIKHVGSGLKTLEMMDLLPVDYIKLDASVTNNLKTDKESLGSLKAITNAAHESGKTTIADCLEEQSDLFVLFENNVDFAQGSYIQEPNEDMNFDFSGTLEDYY